MKSKVSPTQRALNLWAIILIVWAIYRAKFRMPEWFDEFIAKPIVFIGPVYYYIKKIEKKDFFSSLNLSYKNLIVEIGLGVLIGIIFIASALLAQSIKYHRILLVHGMKLNANLFIVTLIMSLATSISEEILSRGFILKRLYDESKNILTASFFASILFFFLHVPILFTNAKISGNLLLFFMGTDMVLSLANSFIFLERKSLTLPILIHALYNMTILFFI